MNNIPLIIQKAVDKPCLFSPSCVASQAKGTTATRPSHALPCEKTHRLLFEPFEPFEP